MAALEQLRNVLTVVSENCDYQDGNITFPAHLFELLQKIAGIPVESHYTEDYDYSDGHMSDVRFGGTLDETGE